MTKSLEKVLTVYQATYVKPTWTAGAAVRVVETMTGNVTVHAFDHALGGGVDQYANAVRLAANNNFDRIVHGGYSSDGWFFIVERTEG